MGVSVDPVMPGREGDLLEYFANQFVMTLPQLTSNTAWAELRHLPVRANDVSDPSRGRRGHGLHERQRTGPRLARGTPGTIRRARRQWQPREGLAAGAAARPRHQLRARRRRAGHQRAGRGAPGYSAVIGQITDFTSEMRLAGKPPWRHARSGPRSARCRHSKSCRRSRSSRAIESAARSPGSRRTTSAQAR